MVKADEVIVTNKGIERVESVYISGEYTTELIIPKEVFREAFLKFVVGDAEEGLQNDK